MKRAFAVAGMALILLVACEPPRRTTTVASPKASGSVSASQTTPPYVARGPFLKERTGIRVLSLGNPGLTLVDLDSGKETTLIRYSDTSGEYWWLTKVHGGFIAQGSNSTGAGNGILNVWYIKDGISPRVQLLGRGNASLDEPAGGVWLINMPRNSGDFGAGTVTLVDTAGEMIRRGTAKCCQRFDVSLGDGRFVTERQEGRQAPPNYGYQGLTVYNVFTERFERRLTPPGKDAEFLRMEGGSVVWKEYECPNPCMEHVVNPDTGVEHTQPWSDAESSPDGAHRATEVGTEGAHSIRVDDRALKNSASSGDGLAWSPDSIWLLFVRPDHKHFGVWRAGDDAATTARRTFTLAFDWAIFDQR